MIIKDNTKKRYPKPGPGAHFLSAQSIRKLDDEKQELMNSRIPKKGNKKSSCALAARNFCLVENFKDASAFPAPTRYNPGVSIT